jgi:phage/plasmid-associated DNA primase
LIPQSEINRTVQAWDGKTFGKDDDLHSINLSFAKIKSIINCLAIEMQRDGFFDAPEAGINCLSGFIKFDPKTFKPRLVRHSSDHRQRQTVAARWEPADEPRKLPEKSLANKLLTGCFKDDVDAAEKIALLGEVAGAIALGYGTRHKAPKAMVFLGRTAENGKSQVLDMYRGLVPATSTVSVAPSKFGDTNEVVRLVGKTLNASDELGNYKAIQSDVFKAVITGEPISGRSVYRQPVEFRAQAQHIFACNQLPAFQGGMGRDVTRRLMPITFNRTIPLPERVLRIGERAAAEELALVLGWAVDGAASLLKRGHFPELESATETLRDWIGSADYVLGWIEDRVDAVPKGTPDAPEARTSSLKAWEDFKAYAQKEDIKIENFMRRSFIERVRAAGFTYKKSGNFRGFVGMKLRGGGRMI